VKADEGGRVLWLLPVSPPQLPPDLGFGSFIVASLLVSVAMGHGWFPFPCARKVPTRRGRLRAWLGTGCRAPSFPLETTVWLLLL
jgi:hypothetical protein